MPHRCCPIHNIFQLLFSSKNTYPLYFIHITALLPTATVHHNPCLIVVAQSATSFSYSLAVKTLIHCISFTSQHCYQQQPFITKPSGATAVSPRTAETSSVQRSGGPNEPDLSFLDPRRKQEVQTRTDFIY
ncbi:unnamed protein product [Gongylonema pulchrum]|uniref:Uncharacterized protein n=1 Tax=Gongylonema pulchrum TaxID=637853 RepID=A0A183EQQ3_9BILA|nr:unnamed protein product [Gongylonema pulchrum]